MVMSRAGAEVRRWQTNNDGRAEVVIDFGHRRNSASLVGQWRSAVVGLLCSESGSLHDLVRPWRILSPAATVFLDETLAPYLFHGGDRAYSARAAHQLRRGRLSTHRGPALFETTTTRPTHARRVALGIKRLLWT